MRLRDALDLCTDAHQDDWVQVPGNRPATSMLAGLFDPGMSESRLSSLTGHSTAIYEPNPRLSMVWPVPEDDEDGTSLRGDRLPEWVEHAPHDWKIARGGFVVVLIGGAPVWQVRTWYLDWGSGTGGYVSDFQAVFSEDRASGTPSIERWETTAWAAGLARLINTFSATGNFHTLDPTPSLAPQLSPTHPIDAERAGY
ncbi:MAG: hypothetical protein ABW065_02405 [Solirubrobacterales bacterium]